MFSEACVKDSVRGVYPSMHWAVGVCRGDVCRDTLITHNQIPRPMTIEAGGMHPTGMHSFHLFFLMKHSALGNFHFGVYNVTFTTFSYLFHNFPFVSLCQVLV